MVPRFVELEFRDPSSDALAFIDKLKASGIPHKVTSHTVTHYSAGGTTYAAELVTFAGAVFVMHLPAILKFLKAMFTRDRRMKISASGEIEVASEDQLEAAIEAVRKLKIAAEAKPAETRPAKKPRK